MAPPGRMEQSAPQWSKQDDNCKGYGNTWGTVLSSEPHLFCALIGHGCVASGPHVMSDHWLATTWCFCLLCFASFECTGFDSIDISFMEPRKKWCSAKRPTKGRKVHKNWLNFLETSWTLMMSGATIHHSYVYILLVAISGTGESPCHCWVGGFWHFSFRFARRSGLHHAKDFCRVVWMHVLKILWKALIEIVGDGMRSCIYASPMGGREGL